MIQYGKSTLDNSKVDFSFSSSTSSDIFTFVCISIGQILFCPISNAQITVHWHSYSISQKSRNSFISVEKKYLYILLLLSAKTIYIPHIYIFSRLRSSLDSFNGRSQKRDEFIWLWSCEAWRYLRFLAFSWDFTSKMTIYVPYVLAVRQNWHF